MWAEPQIDYDALSCDLIMCRINLTAKVSKQKSRANILLSDQDKQRLTNIIIWNVKERVAHCGDAVPTDDDIIRRGQLGTPSPVNAPP